MAVHVVETLPKQTVYFLSHYALLPNHFSTTSDVQESCKRIRSHIIKVQPHFLSKLTLAISATYEVINKKSDEIKLIRGSFNIHNECNHLLNWTDIDLNNLEREVNAALETDNVSASLFDCYEDSEWVFYGDIIQVILQFQATFTVPSFEEKPVGTVEKLKIWPGDVGQDIRTLFRTSMEDSSI